MVEIRNLSIEDINDCALLYQKVFAEAPWLESFDYDTIKQYFLHCCNDKLYGGYVANNDDLLYGFITYFIKPSAAGNVLYVDELCVDKDIRKNGIGTKLIKKIENLVKERDLISILIHTDKSSDAYKLYKNQGFECDDSVVALYKNY